MSYLLAQILVCLLVAGLIGAIIGWFLRGGCSKKIEECEDEWKMRVGALESDFNSRLHETKNRDLETTNLHSSSQQATLKSSRTPSEVEDGKGFKKEIVAGVVATTATTLAATDDEISKILSTPKPNLDQHKRDLYLKHGIDLDKERYLEDEYDVQFIDGIGRSLAQGLKEMGINTTSDIVKKIGKNSQTINDIAKRLKVSDAEVASWVSMSDLLKLPGMDSKVARLLQTVGISSVAELAVTNSDSLFNEMASFNSKNALIPTIPSKDWIKRWTELAKELG